MLDRIVGIKKDNFSRKDVDFLIECMKSGQPPYLRRAARNRIVYLLRNNNPNHGFDYLGYLFRVFETEKRDTWLIRNLAEALILLGDNKTICRVLESINRKGLDDLIRARVYSFCRIIIKSSSDECLKSQRPVLEHLETLFPTGGNDE